MQAYPAYTVERIETELSWRQVKLLTACWNDKDMVLKSLIRIEKMLELKFKMKKVSTQIASDDQLINEIAGMGWL